MSTMESFHSQSHTHTGAQRNFVFNLESWNIPAQYSTVRDICGQGDVFRLRVQVNCHARVVKRRRRKGHPNNVLIFAVQQSFCVPSVGSKTTVPQTNRVPSLWGKGSTMRGGDADMFQPWFGVRWGCSGSGWTWTSAAHSSLCSTTKWEKRKRVSGHAWVGMCTPDSYTGLNRVMWWCGYWRWDWLLSIDVFDRLPLRNREVQGGSCCSASTCPDARRAVISMRSKSGMDP